MVNVNYREVKRKAAVGERIRVVAVNPESLKVGNVNVGEEFTVKSVDGKGDVWEVSERTFRGVISPDWNGTREYVVLEPFTTARRPQEPDALAANFRQFVLDNADAIRAILPQVEAKFSVGTDGDVTAMNVTVAQPKPLARAEVIAKATDDVTELTRIGRSVFSDLPGVSPLYGKFYEVEFHVNHEKRAVTALVKRGRTVYAKATAKAAPDDVFHAEIGKAIALRRALGLAVPSEYTDAPKPDKAEVGAVIRKVDGACVGDTRVVKRIHRTEYEFTNGIRAFIRNCEVIDDTDVDYSGLIAAGGRGAHSLSPKEAA